MSFFSRKKLARFGASSIATLLIVFGIFGIFSEKTFAQTPPPPTSGPQQQRGTGQPGVSQVQSVPGTLVGGLAGGLASCGALVSAAFGGLAASLGLSAVGLAVPVGGVTLGSIAGSTGLSATIESCLNGIAWAVAKMILAGITRSIVTWINSGFQGGPTFVTNPQAFLSDVADQAFGEVIQGSGLGFLCSPYQIQIKLALLLNRGLQRRSQCTMSLVIKNFDNFIYGFNPYGGYGGWAQWFSLNQGNNNIYGSYLTAQTYAGIQISTAAGTLGRQLDWSGGFLDIREPECVQRITQANAANPNGPQQDSRTVCPVATPGRVIESVLGVTLTSPIRQLELADSINEIIGALLSQLTSQALRGLSSLSSPSVAYGGQSYLDQLQAEQEAQYGQVRGITAQQIQDSIKNESTFIAINQGTLARASSSASLLQSVANCYQSKANSGGLSDTDADEARARAAQASSTIESTIRPITDKVTFSVQGAQGNLFQLQNLLNNIDSFSPTSLLQRDDLINQFLSIFPYVPNESDLALTQNDASAIVSSLNSLDADTQTKAEACLVFPSTP